MVLHKLHYLISKNDTEEDEPAMAAGSESIEDMLLPHGCTLSWRRGAAERHRCVARGKTGRLVQSGHKARTNPTLATLHYGKYGT